MNVEWIKNEKPDTKWGVSKQLVLLTSKGSFATGYYLKKQDMFLTESFLLKNESVVAWLKGLCDVGKFENNAEEIKSN